MGQFSDRKRCSRASNPRRPTGIGVVHLSKIERGLVGNPTWATVLAIAEALGVSLAALGKRVEA
jgi:hypothetical protein